MSPPSDKETVFAAPPQGRLGFHPCRRLDAGKMLTLSRQQWPTLSRGARWGGQDGADSGWWKQQCARSCGEGVETSKSASCWWGCHIKPAHLGHLASQAGSQVLQQKRCHWMEGCKEGHTQLQLQNGDITLLESYYMVLLITYLVFLGFKATVNIMWCSKLSTKTTIG